MEKTNSHQLIKIAIVGPESTGKSTLAAALAQSFNTLWVKEFAREYCEQFNGDCTLADELAIFYGQLKAEEKCIEDLMALNNFPAILISDTTILNVKVWCEHVFGTVPAIVKQTCDTRKYDLYFVMKDDIPWEEDPLRNFPNQRPYFFKVFQNELESRKENYYIIEGDFDNRIALAKKHLNNYISTLPL